MQGLKSHQILTKASHPSNIQEIKLKKNIKTPKTKPFPSALFKFIAEGDEQVLFG